MQTNHNSMKRYTIFNFYVRGSNQSPQAAHGLNNLWKKSLTHKDKVAVDLFYEWANNHEIEIMLQGGEDEDLENLYTALSGIEGVLSAKFNEVGLRNACTVVTFVASEAIVAGVNYVRGNRLNPYNVKENLSNSTTGFWENNRDWPLTRPLTESEIEVVSMVAFLPMAP